MAPWLGHTMVSRQEVPRPLLTPGEVMQLPASDALIMTGGSPPIRARKVRYFDEPAFKARLRPPVTIPVLSGRGIATAWDGLVAPVAPPAAKPAFTPPKQAPRQTTRRTGSSHQKAFDFAAPGTATPGATVAGPAIERPDDADILQAADPIRIQFGIDPDAFENGQ